MKESDVIFAIGYVRDLVEFFKGNEDATRLHINRMFHIGNITESRRNACIDVLVAGNYR